MIELKLEFATGIEMREALEQLLNGSLVTTKIRLPEPAIGVEKTAENFEVPKMEVEKPAEETAAPGKKRRTKAEIEAEKNASAPAADETDIQSDNDVAETDNKEATTVTAVMLQEKAVSLIRNNKKSEVVAIIKKFGGDSISQADKNPLKVEVYADVMDELNKIV